MGVRNRKEEGVGGIGPRVAASAVFAEVAAVVSGDLVEINVRLARCVRNKFQEGPRRDPSVPNAAGEERAWRPNGGNREANEEAPVNVYFHCVV